jgi:subtilisin family serine protease/plastocyanin
LCDTEIQLIGDDGVVCYTIDTDDDSGEGNASKIIWNCYDASNNPFYIVVTEKYDRGGPTTNYDVEISWEDIIVPQMPIAIAPADEEQIATLTPSFEWSAFQHGGDGESQTGYQLRVRCDTDGDVVVYETGFINSTSTHQHTYDPGAYSGTDPETGVERISNSLEWNKQYHWHVRYQDSGGDWSAWSDDDPDPHQDFYTVQSMPDIEVTPTSITINEPDQVSVINNLESSISSQHEIDSYHPHVKNELILKFYSFEDISFTYNSEDNRVQSNNSNINISFEKLNVGKMRPIYVGKNVPEELKNTFIIQYNGDISLEDAIFEVKQITTLEWVDLNYIFQLYEGPNDPNYSQQWYLPIINAEDAWEIGTGSSSVSLGIIDTGVDWDHPDLSSSIWNNDDEIPDNGIDDDLNGYIDDVRGWDWVDNISNAASGEDGNDPDNNPMDFNGHGTHCSGIAAATTNNSTGVASISNGCKIMCLRAGYEADDGKGYVTFAAATSAIQYAIDNGARVISMSFGGGSSLLAPVINAFDNNVVVCHAAGNEDSSIASAIDGIEQTLSVAATDQSDKKASFSNYGDWIDVSAPGVSIFNTYFNNTYASSNGTSMSTPLVAGLAGLLISIDPSKTASQIIEIIKTTADNIDSQNPGYEAKLGTGRINAFAAISDFQNPQFIIQNVGNGTLSITSILDNQNWLSVNVFPSTPFTLDAGEAQSVDILIDWDLVGSTSQTAIITIASNDPDEPSVNVSVTANPQLATPLANFSPTNAQISVGETVSFTDLSTNTPSSWAWTFEGGTPASSTLPNPIVTYNSVGEFDVTLTVSNADGSDTKTIVDAIDVIELTPPTANFSPTNEQVSIGETVSFTDLSTNTPNNWAWTFEGGTPASSTLPNPIVTYNSVGEFDVSLTVSNADGSDTKTVINAIAVDDGSSPDWTVNPAEFSYEGEVTAEVFLDDLPAGSGILGAFVNDTCRGVMDAPEVGPTDKLVYIMRIYSNEASGEEISFKFFYPDMLKQVTLDPEDLPIFDIRERIPFESDMIIGDAAVPFEMNAYSYSEYQKEMTSGWNWFSAYLINEDMTLDTILSSLNPQAGDYIKDRKGTGNSATFYDQDEL